MNAVRTSASFGPDRSPVDAAFWIKLAEAAQSEPEPEHGERTARSDWHYKDKPYSKRDAYDGPLLDLPEQEVLALLQESLLYFGINSDMPSPPAGLPGTSGNYYLSAKSVADAGARYLLALIEGRMRTVWSAHDQILNALNKQYHLGRDAGRQEHRDLMTDERATGWLDAEPLRDATVYFIGSDPGPIKIGIATNVQNRLKALQTSNPHKLQVLATCEGGRDQETAYHNLFMAHRLTGEWFNPHPDILAEIERLNRECAA